MMKALIVGANGQIGTLLTQKMKESTDWQPVAMIRNKEQATKFDKMEIPTIMGDLEWDTDKLENVAARFDAIVFTAGSGGSTGADKTLLIDLDGAVKMIEAAEAKNVKRFVMVSALGAGTRKRWNEAIKAYYVAKHYADDALQCSSLDYTIVRPGRLLNEPGTGKIEAGTEVERSSIPRADVADILIEVLRKPATIGMTFDVVTGDKEIAEAISTLER